MKFVIELIAKKQELDSRIQSQLMQDRVIKLLQKKKAAIDRLKQLQHLKFVSIDTKQQFAFLVMFAYFWWL